MSSARPRREVGELRRWVCTESSLEVGVGDVSSRTELCLKRCKLGKECATHFDFDFWYTALWKVRGGRLPDSEP